MGPGLRELATLLVRLEESSYGCVEALEVGCTGVGVELYAQVCWRALAGFLLLLSGHDGSFRWNGFRNLLPCASR